MLSGQIKLIREMGFKQHLQDEGRKRVTLDLEEQTEQKSLGGFIQLGFGEEIVDENLLGRKVEGETMEICEF